MELLSSIKNLINVIKNEMVSKNIDIEDKISLLNQGLTQIDESQCTISDGLDLYIDTNIIQKVGKLTKINLDFHANADIPSNSTVFIVPIDYRPNKNIRTIVTDITSESNTLPTYATIQSNGNIVTNREIKAGHFSIIESCYFTN